MKYILLPIYLLVLTVTNVAHSVTMQGFKYYSEEYPPYNYIEQQSIKGIAVDLLFETGKRTGSKITESQIDLLPWPRAYHIVQTTPNTVLLTAARTASREADFKWLGPIGKTRVVVLAKKQSNIVINKPQDLTQHVIGIVREDISEHLLRDTGIKGIKVEYANTAFPLVKMLNSDRVDLWAYEEQVARSAITLLGFNNEDFEVVYVLQELELYYAFNIETDDKLIQHLQQSFNQLKRTSEGSDTSYYDRVLMKYGMLNLK